MTKFLHDDVLDNGLQYIKDNCDKIVALEGYAATYADANDQKGTNTGKNLAEVATTSPDFTLANGDVSGRKVTSAVKNGVSILQDGNADHIGWLDTVNSQILAITDNSETDALVTGNDVNFLGHKVELADVTA